MNYSNIPANSPLETQMKRESCFCKAAAWGFLLGCHCFVSLFCCCSCCFVLFYVCTCKKIPVHWNLVKQTMIIPYWCSDKQFQRSAVKALCTPCNCSFRRKHACVSSYKYSLQNIQCIQRKTRHSLWPSCNIQQLLGAIYDNIISSHSTWLSAELFAGDLPHWQIRYRVSNISFSRATAQNYILWFSARVTMLMPKLISHPITDEIINTIPLWPQIRLFGFFFFGWGEGLYLFFFPFPIFFFPFLH